MAASAIGVELRATAWPVVTGVSALAAVTGAAGVAWPGGGPTLLPISFALLAAAAAFLLDEPVWWWALVGVCAAAIAVALTGPPARG
jgi:hypothetical protein